MCGTGPHNCGLTYISRSLSVGFPCFLYKNFNFICLLIEVIIQSTEEKQKSLKNIRKMFAQNESFSDHIIYLSAFNHWLGIEDRNQKFRFCREYLLSNSTLEVIDGIRGQLLSQLESAGFIRRNTDEHNQNANHWPTVKAALTAGAYPKLIRFDEHSQQYCNRKEKIRFHNTSQLAEQTHPRRNGRQMQEMPTHWSIYEEILQMGRHSYAKTCTAVSPITIALFCGPSEQNVPKMAPNVDLSSTEAQLQIDDWISFDTNAQTVIIVEFLKQQLNKLFVRRIESLSAHNQTNSPSDDLIIKTIVDVLDREEGKSGFNDSKEFNLRPVVRSKSMSFVPKPQVLFELILNYP